MNSRRGEAPGYDPGSQNKWWQRVLVVAALAGVGWTSAARAASPATTNPDLRYGGPVSWDMTGPAGGPFTNTSISIKLGNRSNQPLDFTSSAPSFVQLSPSSGTIPGRTRVPVAGTINTSAANALAAGLYTGSMVFHNNTSNEADIVVPVTLTVTSPTLSGSVTPATDFSSQGAAGGPFTPDSVVYTLTNTGTVDLPWRAVAADNWVGASPGSGTVPVGGSVNITVSIQDAATAAFSNGIHPSSVTFSETSGGTTLATRLVSLNVQAGQQSSGWTQFNPSADTRIVYVSSSTGNDANDGYSQNTPKRTLAAARAVLRNGYPDWMLLKCGDAWNENFGGGFGLSGRSATEPMLLSSYGTGARPTIQSGTGNAFSIWGNGDGNNLAIVGLRLWPNTYDGINGTPRCIVVFGSVSNLLIEDCYFQAAETNVVIQGASENPGPTGRHSNISFRRNVVVDAYNTGTSNSEGMFVSGTDGLLIEENVFDHNGWRDDVAGSGPTWYRHNVYIQNLNTGVVFRGNIVASTDGLQARSGGDIEENLVMHNAINIIVGGGGFPDIEPNGVVTTTRHNVVLDGNDLQAGSPRGWGLYMADIQQGTVDTNVISSNVSGHGPVPLTLDVSNNGVGVHDTAFTNNIIYNWNGVSTVKGDGTTIYNITFQNNKLQNHITAEPLIEHDNQSSTAGFNSANNVFDTSAAWNACMAISGGDISLATWKPLVHDTTSVEQSATFPDPGRSIATYHASIGGSPTLVDFMAQARLQSKAYWRDQYTARAVNDYIRAGFGL
jgi:hypothetical protein